LVLLCITVVKGDHLEDILEAFLELGITGATVLDARGMGQILSQDVPIFAGLRNLFPGGQGEHSFVMSVAEESKAEAFLDRMPQICGCLQERGTGIAFTLPVTRVEGLAKEL